MRVFVKTLAIIDSCKSTEQLIVAKSYLYLAEIKGHLNCHDSILLNKHWDARKCVISDKEVY